MKRKGLLLVLVGLLAVVMAACGEGDETEATSGGASAPANSDVELPDTLNISSYDIGSTGYNEIAAISDALTKSYGTQIRMMPSASGLARLEPLRDGTAEIGGRLADEVFFAFEGIEEFATPDWGPQDLRYLAPILNHVGIFTMEDSDIETLEDLEGVRIPHIIGNPSINIKFEAILAAANLTWDDVEVVEIASYGDQPDMVAQGQLDAGLMVPGATALMEADELHGVKWLDHSILLEDDAMERLSEIYPFGAPEEWDLGAALTEGEPELLLGYYTYAPAVYADADEDLVYNFLKALDETYDMYKDATALMFVWNMDEVNVEPLGVPLHEGAIRFFEEKGMWTDEYQEKNDEFIARQEQLQEAWETVLAEAEEQGIGEGEFEEFWLERKAELVDE